MGIKSFVGKKKRQVEDMMEQRRLNAGFKQELEAQSMSMDAKKAKQELKMLKRMDKDKKSVAALRIYKQTRGQPTQPKPSSRPQGSGFDIGIGGGQGSMFGGSGLGIGGSGIMGGHTNIWGDTPAKPKGSKRKKRQIKKKRK